MSEKKKCPLCSKKLVITNGVPTCPDCGYRDSAYSKATGASATGFQATDSGSSGSGMSGSGQPVKKKGDPSAKWVVAAVSSLAGVVLVGVLIGLLKGGLSDLLRFMADRPDPGFSSQIAFDSDAVDSIRENQENRENQGQWGEGSEAGESGQSPRGENFFRPESDFLVALTEMIFGKPVDEITYEELYSIIYLDVYYWEDADVMEADVVLSDETRLGYVMTDYRVDTNDLRCLEGLEYLYLEKSIDYGTNWRNLRNLRVLSCESDLWDLKDCMDVSQLISVRTDFTFSMFDLSVLSEYTGLEYLSMKIGHMDSLEGVSQLTSLKGLNIEDGDFLSNFSDLYNMTWLEELSIESKGLKDIGFVSGMDNLTYLSLEGTGVKKIDALADCADTLVGLSLVDNYQIEDISPVMGCTGLEELQIWVEYQFDVPMEVPDFSAMTNLRRLSIEGYDKFTNLALLTGLEELTIECSGSRDGEFLKSLSNLRILNLVDMSVHSGLIEGIAGVESLEVLSLEDCFAWCDISPVFGLPNLRELNLEWAECGLRPELLQTSSLTSLTLTHAAFDRLLEDGSWDYDNYGKKIPMQEVLDAIAPFTPQMMQLYAQGHDLDSVSFVENMPHLVMIDVSNNYITDLAPLTGLEELLVLICEDNPIRSTEGLEDVIIVR